MSLSNAKQELKNICPSVNSTSTDDAIMKSLDELIAKMEG